MYLHATCILFAMFCYRFYYHWILLPGMVIVNDYMREYPVAPQNCQKSSKRKVFRKSHNQSAYCSVTAQPQTCAITALWPDRLRRPIACQMHGARRQVAPWEPLFSWAAPANPRHKGGQGMGRGGGETRVSLFASPLSPQLPAQHCPSPRICNSTGCLSSSRSISFLKCNSVSGHWMNCNKKCCLV